MPLAILCHV
jgi:kynureninase